MRVYNTRNQQKGDDDYFDRLLSYFQTQFYERIIKMVPIRKSVIYLRTEKNTYVIKGYHTNSRLRLQEAFTTTLKKEGFTKTYLFLTPPVREQLFFEGTYFGCMEYIPPNKSVFSFHSHKNRQEGIELLEKFHQTTASFEARYRTLLPKGHLIEKWTERLNVFSNNLPHLGYFINEPYIADMLSWANWSLEGMETNRSFFQKEPTLILHGDVAHHNFLRDREGQLNLIDFDLISIGPASFDYLQYSNRILPYIDWSFERLSSLKQINKYLHEAAFLYALAYPADIFREWNRMIREKSYTDQIKYKQVMDLTTSQFYARKKFIKHLKALLD
ncbi:aminoglycoside phosphotransferase family protein [Bacillus sp. sid0103]|uniref:phosphotransferase n=1 Tax=Bacillus sp. sid0103 TaxID=2856337 RepID=UPI001C43F05A|nr:phosphotransferase [Bacillus sp. sid0103]MBV7505962.1 aminoglycoside phosphotransferase family protein [Bacillus sp. sid0103]